MGYTYTYFCIHTLTYIHVTKVIEEKEAITLIVSEKERTWAELQKENMGGAGGRKGNWEVMQLYFNFKVQKKEN